MPDPQAQRCFSVSFRLSINSGAALMLFLPSFFGLVLICVHSANGVSIFPAASLALTGAFGGFLIKRGVDKRMGAKSENERMMIQNGNGGSK